jgi:hypothetical protein
MESEEDGDQFEKAFDEAKAQVEEMAKLQVEQIKAGGI